MGELIQLIGVPELHSGAAVPWLDFSCPDSAVDVRPCFRALRAVS